MNSNIKTRNLSETQTIQCFNSTQIMNIKEHDFLDIKDLENIYNYLYENNFHNILIKGKACFLNLIEKEIQEVIKYHFDEDYVNNSIFRKSINKMQKDIENKYLKDFSFLNEQYNKNINELKENERKYIYNFLQHCVNTKDIAYHLCSPNKKGKFILVSENNFNDIIENSKSSTYAICLGCKQCYNSSCIYTICISCNKQYYTSIMKENEDNNIVLATWEKYHCGGTLTDQIMKCIKCKKELYLNLTTNKLICLNKECNFESKPKSILWKCTFCSKEFRSKAKVYNPLEFQLIKKAINFALLMKLRASPSLLPCCKKDINDLIFYHKEECKGILYKGYLKGKIILVCKKCHAMNFLDKFNWICPLCGKKFHSYNTNSTSTFKYNRLNYSLEKIKANNNNNNNNNELNHKNKILSRIILKREYSISSLKDNKNEYDKKDNNVNNVNNVISLNKKKDMYLLTDKYLNSLENNSNLNKDNENNEFYKVKGNNSRNNLIIDNLSTDKESIIKRKRKKNRITLYEVLEKRKNNYSDRNFIKKNISLKDAIDYSMIENNFNITKNLGEVESNSNNNNIYLNGKDLNTTIIAENYSKEKLGVTNTKDINKENIINRNAMLPNYMKSYDSLTEKKNLIKCKSSNLFKKNQNNNTTETSSKNKNKNKNKDNHQINYLYTTNSNYNIKVSLNINQNICSYAQKNEKINENKTPNNNNNNNIYPNEGLNQIKDIYLKEILKNTGINLDNVINNNLGNIITTVKEENDHNKNENKNNLKNNINKNKLRLENIGLEVQNKKEKNYLFKKNGFERRTENINNKKEFIFHPVNKNIRMNKFKNPLINSQKNQHQNKITNINYYSEQNNNNNETLPKKLIHNRFMFLNINNNNNKYNKIINTESKEINNNEKNSQQNPINKPQTKIKTKIDSMKNVIASPEIIDDLNKQSLIPFFTDKEYKYIRPIGEGTYGLIYLVENIHNKKQYALKKILCKDLYEIYKHKNQLELIYSMNHPKILELYNIQYKFLDSTTYAIYVLMERAQNDWSVDIRKRIINQNPYKQEEIINILKQVVSGLSYLQKKNITHRDIKPQNILIFKGNIFKVADLGEAKSAENKNQQMTLRGSELYMSPILYEEYKKSKKEVFHNPYKSDVFSLGFSCLYAMNLKLKVIENIREFKNMKIIINSIKKDLNTNRYSDKLMEIIFKMIDTDENKRYDFVELEKDLKLYF